jgi:hypothetical protein
MKVRVTVRFKLLALCLLFCGCSRQKFDSRIPPSPEFGFSSAFLVSYFSEFDLAKNDAHTLPLKDVLSLTKSLAVNFSKFRNEGAGFVVFQFGPGKPPEIRCRVKARGELNYSRPFAAAQSSETEIIFPLNLSTMGPYSILADENTFFTLECKEKEKLLAFDFQIKIFFPKENPYSRRINA